jgi:predicted nucleic acid-binding protein
MSAVVVMELRAGAFSPRDRKLLQRLEGTFRQVERLVVPSETVYSEAGDVLRLLQSRRGYQLRGSHSIVNDVLIALSARSIGAAVVTQNADDYSAIRSIRPFRLQIV